MEVSVRVDTRNLDNMAGELRGRLQAVVAKAAFDIEAEAKSLSPVDTGANRASIYTTLSGGDGYSPAASDARARRPWLQLLAPLTVEPDAIEASIGPSTDYAILLELGTTSMPARPFMTPALEHARGPFLEAVKQTIQGAAHG